MKKILIISIFAVMLSGCSPEDLFSMLAQSDVEQAAGEAVERADETVMTFDQKIEEIGQNFEQSTNLTSVMEDGSYGTAFKSVDEESGLSHQVWAVLPPLEEEGAFYEGWLVEPDSGKFISTGPMKLDDDQTTRYLEFYSSIDFPTYTKVVITKELIQDKTPETHIIEGEFN